MMGFTMEKTEWGRKKKERRETVFFKGANEEKGRIFYT